MNGSAHLGATDTGATAVARTIDHDQHEQMTLRAFAAVKTQGVAGLSMARIARDVGVKRSTLYWYFGNLGELFEAVLQVVLEQQAIFVAGEVAAHSHPIDQLLAWIHGVHRFYGDDPALLPVLIQWGAVGRPAEPEAAIAHALAQFEPLRQAAITLLEDGMADGTVAPCDADVIVDLCATMIDGALVHRVSRNLAVGPVLAHFARCVLEPLRRPAGPGTDARADGGPTARTTNLEVGPHAPTRARTNADWLEED